MKITQKEQKLLDTLNSIYTLYPHKTSLFIYSKGDKSSISQMGKFLCEIDTKNQRIIPHRLIKCGTINVTHLNVVEKINEYLKLLDYDSDFYNPMFRDGVTENYIVDTYLKNLNFRRKSNESYVFDNIKIIVPDFNIDIKGDRTNDMNIYMYIQDKTYTIKCNDVIEDILKNIDTILYTTVLNKAVDYSKMVKRINFSGDSKTELELLGLTVLSKDTLEDDVTLLENIIKEMKENL